MTYSKFITNSSAPATTTSAANSSLVSNRTGPGLQRMDSVHGRSRELKNFYILSMGHRIQFIQYDEAGVSGIAHCASRVRWKICCAKTEPVFYFAAPDSFCVKNAN